ncbi:unnamed protein product [Euphydryas editha]|uniref:Polyprotein n=1 Tax=Euphydryas editha TaxID=104508 RepID=A0AAU9TSL9_EUPED|nr:unnamed protein product [Euphydryas editha]
MAQIPKEKLTKFDRKAKKHILLGFSNDIKGYRIYDPVKKQVITSRDVVILEKTEKEKTATVSIERTNSVGESMEESIGEQQTVNKREARITRKPERYGYANACTTSIGDVGMTYAEAISGPENQQWLQAMADELQSFKDNQVWELLILQIILVAKGFTQKPGVDYQETFSPVIRHSTLRLLFALSVQYGMNITHLDVTTAFLNSQLKENIFMHIPEGLTVKECESDYEDNLLEDDVQSDTEDELIDEAVDIPDCSAEDHSESGIDQASSSGCRIIIPSQRTLRGRLYPAEQWKKLSEALNMDLLGDPRAIENWKRSKESPSVETIHNMYYKWFRYRYSRVIIYTANMNDAKIMRIILNDPNGLIKLLNKGDIIIVDRGFRDVKVYLEELGFKMPAMKRKRHQLTTDVSNESRFVTKIRWVVEAVHGNHHKLDNKLLPKTSVFCRIACF